MKLLYSLILLTVFTSCQKEKSWHDKIILADDQVTMVASIDLLGIVNKMDVSKSELPIDQKIMLNGILSSLDSDILGFKLEGSHRFFLVPEEGERNGGVFVSGDVVELEKFKSTIKSTFGGIQISDGEVDVFYAEEFNLTIGYNAKNFIAGISLDKEFTVSKIESYFKTSNSNEISDSSIETYLERKDDFSYFLSADKLLMAVEKMNIPFFSIQDLPIPNVNSFVALNFNDGDIVLESEILSVDNASNPSISGNGLDEKFTRFLTDNDELIGFVLANLNTDEIVNQIDNLSDQKEISRINRNLKRFNVTLNDLVNMFDGQLSFSLINLPFKPQNDNYDDWNDDEWEEDVNTPKAPKIILNAGLSNQLAFSDFLNKAELKIVQNEIFSDKGMNLLIKDNVFHLSTEFDLLEKISTTNELGSYSMIDNDLINEPIYFELNTNLDYFPREIINAIDEEDGEIAMKELFEEIERVYFHGNGTKSSMNVVFTDKNKNGLAQLIDIISKRLAVLA